MNIAIIDDVKKERETAISYIRQYFEQKKSAENFLPLQFHEFSSGEEFLASFEYEKYDLLILDIFMDGISGFEVAKQLFQKNASIHIIFFTSSMDYVLNGYSLHVSGYILKPLQQYVPSFFNALDFVCNSLAPDTQKTLFPLSFSDEFILHKNICYLESSLRKLYLHCSNDTYIISGNYKTYRNVLLSDARFVECYRSIIVNMDFIDHIKTDTIFLKTGESLPISRRKKYDVFSNYTKHLLNTPI